MKLIIGIIMIVLVPGIFKGADEHPGNILGGLLVLAIGAYLCYSWYQSRNAPPADTGSAAQGNTASTAPKPEPSSDPQKTERLTAEPKKIPVPSAPAVPAQPAEAQPITPKPAKEQPVARKTCSYCGHVYEPGDTFCTQCGAMENDAGI